MHLNKMLNRNDLELSSDSMPSMTRDLSPCSELSSFLHRPVILSFFLLSEWEGGVLGQAI